MNLAEVVLFWLILVFSVSLHELFHGWTAYKLGDDTAQRMGRLTLNPIAHIDLIGTVILPLVMLLRAGVAFGWAKPVPVNYASLRDPKRDIVLIGFSGPLANFLIALSLSWVIKAGLINNASLLRLLVLGITINLILATFNLIPIPPLDGSKVLMGFLPHRLAVSYSRLEPYGFFIVIGLLMLGVLGGIISPIIGFLMKMLLL